MSDLSLLSEATDINQVAVVAYFMKKPRGGGR